MTSPDARIPIRRPGTAQAVTLILAEALPAMGSVLLAPAIPKMLAHFQPLGVGAYMVMLAIVAPAACIGLVSPFAGALLDRIGHRRALVGALALYGLFGTAPLFFDSIFAIIALRFALGCTEAVILTANLSLLGDYFQSQERTKWIAIQSGAMPIFGSFFFLFGGALTGLSWKAPFIAYATSFLVLVLTLIFLFDPPSARTDKVTRSASVHRVFSPQFVVLCGVTLVSVTLFFIVPLQFSILLDANAGPSPSVIGTCLAITAVGNAVGAYGFRYVSGISVYKLLGAGFVVAGAGLLIAAPSPSIIVMTMAGFLNQVGCGIVVPALASAILDILPASRRSMGSSIWWSSFYIGNFLTPMVTVFASAHAGGPARGFFALGLGTLLFALVLGVLHLALGKPGARALSAGTST